MDIIIVKSMSLSGTKNKAGSVSLHSATTFATVRISIRARCTTLCDKVCQ